MRAPLARSGKKAGYSLSFYLVTRTGGEVLAVQGKDAGDAHYRYNSVPAFDATAPPGGPGPLADCHNRRDLVRWLEGVARASQAAADFHVVSSDDDRAAQREGGGGGRRLGCGSGERSTSPAAAGGNGPASPPFDQGPPDATAHRPRAYPVYIAHRSTKFDLPDGRRGLKWWLVADSGVEYLAATGEERDARDGHYTYHAAPPGSAPGAGPMTCHNMAGVERWLEDIMARSQQGGEAARTPPPEVSAAWVEPTERPVGSGGAGRRRGGSGSGSPPRAGGAAPNSRPGSGQKQAGKGIPPGAAVLRRADGGSPCASTPPPPLLPLPLLLPPARPLRARRPSPSTRPGTRRGWRAWRRPWRRPSPPARPWTTRRTRRWGCAPPRRQTRQSWPPGARPRPSCAPGLPGQPGRWTAPSGRPWAGCEVRTLGRPPRRGGRPARRLRSRPPWSGYSRWHPAPAAARARAWMRRPMGPPCPPRTTPCATRRGRP